MFDFSEEITLRLALSILVALSLSPNLGSAELPQLAYSRRLLSVTQQFLDKEETKVAPVSPNGTRGRVLAIFWTSERGAVISARALDGPPELQKTTTAALYKWKFKPSSANGQPVQMVSAVLMDFSQIPATFEVPKPMTAAQLLPGIQPRCFDGLLHEAPASLEVCQQQLEAVSRDSESTPSDRFTVHDQYGLVLLKYAHDASRAVEQFSKAIELASERLDSSDAEWAYLHWHRATAEQQLGNQAEAEKDFSVAESSLRDAGKAVGNEKIATYYQDLVSRIVTQHPAR